MSEFPSQVSFDGGKREGAANAAVGEQGSGESLALGRRQSLETSQFFQESLQSKSPGLMSLHPAVHIALLAALVLLCYGRTLTTYFLADDFGHIGYISAMLNGHGNWFWANFTGSFMQIPGIQVYRPFQLICEMIDFSIFKTNAQGWYAFNLAYFTACVSGVYLVVRKLLSSWGPVRAGFIGLFAASLFAVNPLRCESISWMVGRVDVVASLFYLASFLLFLQPRKLATTAGALACFVAGLLVKEMPVGLPVVLIGLTLLGLGPANEGTSGNRNDNAPSLVQRFKFAFAQTYPWWITLVLYFAVRTVCLGTMVGGYATGLGGGAFSAASKWFDPDTWHRMFFPFNSSIIPEPNLYSSILTIAFAGMVALVGFRLITNSMPWRWLAFCALWLATCAAPIFQLWGIGYQLEGGRFFYFFSIPMAMALSLLAFAPFRQTTRDQVSNRELERLTAVNESGKQGLLVSRNATAIGAVFLCAIVVAWAKVTMVTNANWVNAGKEVRRFREACLDLVQASPQQKFVILGVPVRNAGAHQILNGTTFSTLFIPPFCETRLADRFANFEPVMFGPPGLINVSRFKACLSKDFPVYQWNRDKGALEPLQVTPGDVIGTPRSIVITPATAGNTIIPETLGHAQMSRASGSLTLDHVLSDDGVRLSLPTIHTADYDSLVFDAAIKGGAARRSVKVAWSNNESTLDSKLGNDDCASETITTTGKEQHIRVRLSHHWHWFVPQTISSLLILPGSAERVTLRNFRLVSSELESPTLTSAPEHLTGPGVLSLRQKKLTVIVTPRSVPGAISALVEIGKPNFFYDTIEDSGDTAETSGTIKSSFGSPTTIDGARFTSIFDKPGYYQIRARCLNASGEPIGWFSDPITVLVQ